jgi:alpha-glucoside transport system permease protein
MMVVVVSFLWTLPSVGLLITSFRPKEDIYSSGWWTVFQHPFDFTQFQLDNYVHVLETEGMARAFLNSLTIAVPSTIIPMAVAAFAAYAFAWMEFPGRQTIFVVVVGLLVVPLQMTLIPLLRVYSRLGLAGTFLGIWLAHTGYGLPFSVYLLRNFIGTLPKDLLESAFLDGASHLTAFVRLVLPLSVPALASLAIFQFLWVWNDLLVALIYLGGTRDVAPVTLRLAGLVQSLGQDWQLLTAAAFVSMALPLVLFFTLQRYFVRGLLAGSVKG